MEGGLGKGENPSYLGGTTAMYNNIEVDEWGLITLNEKMKELGYTCVDSVKFCMQTVRGLVELVTDMVAWDTFNELDLFNVVEVWVVGGEFDESFGEEDSSYEGGINESECDWEDGLDYDINIDPSVEYCDTKLADLDLDALVSELINGSGITTEQQQGLANVSDGTAITLVQEHRGHEEIDLQTTSTQPPTDGDDDNTQRKEETAEMEDANAQREDENAH
nr:uncharacterized protein LOC109154045 [Ipomoea batatas]